MAFALMNLGHLCVVLAIISQTSLIVNQRMEFYYMVNYYFKYLELLDTVFLAFKKKPMRKSYLASYTFINSPFLQNSYMSSITPPRLFYASLN